METTTSTELVEKYRKVVQSSISLHSYEAATYWAEKVVTLTDDPRDVYWLAQCMYLQRQFHRAANLMQHKNLDKTCFLCTYLTGKCYYEALEYDEAKRAIESSDINNVLSNTSSLPKIADIEMDLFDDTPKHQAVASFMLLKGKVLEALDNRALASECYKNALHYDAYSYEAFDLLVKYQMLNAAEEQKLLDSIPIDQQCEPDEAQVLFTLYRNKLKKYQTPAPFESVQNSTKTEDKMQVDQQPMPVVNHNNIWLSKLGRSLDLHAAEAEQLYYNCDYWKCRKMTEQILRRDPYHEGCLLVHISCLVELAENVNLFSLAHKLVDVYPEKAISWYAVGCYYYVIGKYDTARKYLTKASCLDRLFGSAWLAYGHSFAKEKEHDQAMAAYFKASQLMKGCHLPLLYAGLECGLTNNMQLADKFFVQAQTIAPDDPYVMHEKGVICFQNMDYEKAEQWFRTALDVVKRSRKEPLTETWVALLNNLGHTCRKLRKFDEALEFHTQALLLGPRLQATVASIAYAHALLDNYQDAIDWFHKALSLKRDDTFSTTMLNYLIELWREDLTPFPDFSPVMPIFQSGRHHPLAETTISSGPLDMSLTGGLN